MHMRTLALAALILASCASSPPIRLAIAGIDVPNHDFRGEPAASGAEAVDRLHDRLTASGRFAIVERRIRVDDTRKLAVADWIAYGTLEATETGAFDNETSRSDMEVVVRLRVVRVEDGMILYSRTHRGSVEGAKLALNLENMPEWFRRFNEASRMAVDKLADDLLELAR